MSTRIWEYIILLLMGQYVLQLSGSGGLAFYIHPRYYTLAITAAVITLVVGLVGLLNTMRLQAQGKLVELEHSHEEHELGGGLMRRLFEATKSNFWLDLFLLVVIVLGFAIAPQQLSVRAASQRASTSNIVIPNSNVSTASQFIDNRESYELGDWISALARNPNLSDYVGQEVTVTGFIYVVGGEEPDMFMVSRFVVRCCVVDASPIGISAEYPGWQLDFTEGQWVVISGEFGILESDTSQELIIHVSGMEEADEPDVPYIY